MDDNLIAERQKILERIEKLFAVADRTTTNENEALVALSMAQELMARYNIAAAEIGKGAKDNTIHDNDLLTYFAGWIKPLLGTVARLNFCFYYYESFPSTFIKAEQLDKHARKLYVGSNSRTYLRHNFVGEQANIIAAKMTGEYLISTMEKMVREASRKHPQHERVSFRYSFMNTCSSRLCHRLEERRREAAQSGIVGSTNLPALIPLYQQAEQKAKDFLEAQGTKLGEPKRSLMQFGNAKGIREGYTAGNSIGLDTQLAADKPAGLLR